MNFHHQDRRYVVILSAAKDLSRHAPRSFAALRMTSLIVLQILLLILFLKNHYRSHPRERANSRSSRRLPADGPPPRLRRLKPSSPFSQITSSILALKIDE